MLQMDSGRLSWTSPVPDYVHSIQPNNDKVADIRAMPAPKNIDELQTRLGLIKYLGRFIPNLSAETANTRHLLETDVEFRWTSTHEAEWNYVKQVIVSESVL